MCVYFTRLITRGEAVSERTWGELKKEPVLKEEQKLVVSTLLEKQEAVLTALLGPYLAVCLAIVFKLTETTSVPSKG